MIFAAFILQSSSEKFRMRRNSHISRRLSRRNAIFFVVAFASNSHPVYRPEYKGSGLVLSSAIIKGDRLVLAVWPHVRGCGAVISSLGVTKDSPDPNGGVIARDPITGEPSGLLQEDAAMQLAWDLFPQASKAEYKTALLQAQEWLNREGINGQYSKQISAGLFLETPPFPPFPPSEESGRV